MKCARQSRYWKSYRDSKTFTLTINIYEAHLGFSHGSSGGGSGMSSSFHNNSGGGFHNSSFLHSSSSFHNSSFLHNSSLHGASVDTSLPGSTGGGGPWDTKIVVSLPKDPMGERHETSRAGKTPNPVWDQAVVFRDIDYSELVRVEMRGIRKLGDNPVLASVEFEVHDVMGLSLRDGASVFQLECDRSRARYGVILLAFRFDPPVAADVLGELDGIGSAVVPRGVSTVADQGEEEVITPAWGSREHSQPPPGAEPVYMNVDGHFACLLLDDDTPAYPCKPHLARPPTSCSSSVTFGPPPPVSSSAAASRDRDASPGRSRASMAGGTATGLHHTHHLQHPRLSVGSNSSAKSENSIFDPGSLIHGRGSAARMAGTAEQLSARGGGGGGGGGGDGGSSGGASGKRRSSVGRDSRARPKSLGSSLAHQLSALGLGVGGGAGGGAGGGGGGPKASSGAGNKQLRRGSSGANSSDDVARLETPQHRWAMPRRRPKHHEQQAATGNNAAAAAGTEADNGSSSGGGGGRVRVRKGFPILSGLRARASGGALRARSKSTSAATPYAVDSADSSCASTVRAGEEASMFEPAPSAEPPGGGAAHPSFVAKALCDVPLSLELSPTGFKAPVGFEASLLDRSLSEELASAKE